MRLPSESGLTVRRSVNDSANSRNGNFIEVGHVGLLSQKAEIECELVTFLGR